MKKVLLVFGIVCIIVCVFFLLVAALNMYGYYHVIDGSAHLYDRLHQRMIVSFTIGAFLAVVGIVCFIIRSNV